MTERQEIPLVVQRGTLVQCLLRQYRTEKGKEPGLLAKRLGLSLDQFERMETGYVPVDPMFVPPALDALRVSHAGFSDRLSSVEARLQKEHGIHTHAELPVNTEYILVRRGALGAILGQGA